MLALGYRGLGYMGYTLQQNTVYKEALELRI